MKKKKKARIK